jgi:hypothetical protein
MRSVRLLTSKITFKNPSGTDFAFKQQSILHELACTVRTCIPCELGNKNYLKLDKEKFKVYGFETTLRGELRLRVSENRMLKRSEGVSGWRVEKIA